MRPSSAAFLFFAAILIYAAIPASSSPAREPQQQSARPAPTDHQAAIESKSAQKQPTAQPNGTPIASKVHTFRGKVEKIDGSTGMLTVSGENVPGWTTRAACAARASFQGSASQCLTVMRWRALGLAHNRRSKWPSVWRIGLSLALTSNRNCSRWTRNPIRRMCSKSQTVSGRPRQLNRRRIQQRSGRCSRTRQPRVPSDQVN